ncbi:indolepyruvate ferredoxin oxidoreductase subunit alpha [Megalodesulfovibrio paquesii]
MSHPPSHSFRHPLLKSAAGTVELLLGNEAIVRGALEAGIQCVACYPGTPSSEVPDTFHRVRLTDGESAPFYFEYSTNEKVAMEVAAGAALAGALSLVTMKHVGVNVAADPLMTVAYTGAPGGLVLLAADDPGCHSSQNEQDSRTYARLGFFPVFEPATVQECKDMARDALLLARRTGRPVILRTTTRVSHMRGPCTFGPLPETVESVPFVRNPRRYVPVPACARPMRLALLDHMQAMVGEAEGSSWNPVRGQGDTAVIACSIARAYLHDAVMELGDAAASRLRILDLGLSYPLPEAAITTMLRECRQLLVLEELEPMVEMEVRALAQRLGLPIHIFGKLDEQTAGQAFVQRSAATGLPRFGEYDTYQVKRALCMLLDLPLPQVEACAPVESVQGLPLRPPNLCAGCSHRALYYAVRQEFGDDAIYSSDIGCYTLGMLPPLKTADFLVCMGSSVSAGSGFARFSEKPVLAFIGDSTFFHSGITGLLNAVHNNYDLFLVILDNQTTAMTGHQPHPGADAAALAMGQAQLDIEPIVRSLGVEQVLTVNPSRLNATIKALKELRDKPGVKVLIAKEPCALFAKRVLKRKVAVTAEVKEQGAAVEMCLETLACPAFVRSGSEVAVDPETCSGCMFCGQIAPSIKARKK